MTKVLFQKKDDGSYWVIPEIFNMYKKHFEGYSKPIESQDGKSKVVFVVHGRNRKAHDELFAFLRSIGLHPLEWSEAILKTRKGAPYIGDILEAAFSLAQAVVVLMTPDDEAQLRKPYREPRDPPYEKQLTPQARPNVLFEAGMAMGKFPNRTILIEIGELRPFSDIGGRHTIRLDNSVEKRKDLAQRLKNAGCPVSLSDKSWHTSGDFSIDSEERSSKISHQKLPVRLRKAETAPLRKEKKQKSVLLPEGADITKLNIDDSLLDPIYEQDHRKAVDIYHDAQLSGFSIQVYPFLRIKNRVNIYLKFYSKWADKMYTFVYSETSPQVEHSPPDRRPKFDSYKETFTTLPWKESPRWLQFLKRVYNKIGRFATAFGTYYILSADPGLKMLWHIKFNDDFSGNEYSFEWNGMGLDENSIKQVR